MLLKLFAAIGFAIVAIVGSFALGLGVSYFFDPNKEQGFGVISSRPGQALSDEDFIDGITDAELINSILSGSGISGNDEDKTDPDEDNKNNDTDKKTNHRPGVDSGYSEELFELLGFDAGDSLADAERSLNGTADRIKGGVVAYVEEIDDVVTHIFFPGSLLSFNSKEEVELYLTGDSSQTTDLGVDTSGVTISWTAEIDENIFEISLTTFDNNTIDLISVSAYDIDAINTGVARDPFDNDDLNNAHSSAARAVGLEGLRPDFWR